tara:strand:+ start:653 stop:1045 length:393 start_codon:yes stop_codon:yes gene_type:complete
MKILFASLIALSSISPVLAGESQSGFSEQRTCLKTEYREEYVPGTRQNPGYIKTYNETYEVPCNNDTANRRVYRETTVEYDTNDCTDGKVAGGILGGGLAAALSRGDGRWWAIPLGVVGGSVIGCDIDGG